MARRSRFRIPCPREMTGNRLTERCTLSQRLDKISTNSGRFPRSRAYTRRRPEHPLRGMLQKSRNSQAYLMRKKINCSRSFWNGGSFRQKCRSGPNILRTVPSDVTHATTVG